MFTHLCAPPTPPHTRFARGKAPLPTSEIRQAVDAVKEGGSVLWESGTGVLEQTWSGNGWELVTACTLMCSDIVEKCVVDARANGSAKRRVLWVKHGGEEFSNIFGLTIMGGFTTAGVSSVVIQHSDHFMSTLTNLPAVRKRRRELKAKLAQSIPVCDGYH